MDIAATCTVTYMDAAPPAGLRSSPAAIWHGGFAHDQSGSPGHAASPLNAFKIVNATEPVGAFVQDRHTGILGEFGKQPEMIPVTLNIHGGAADKQFHYEVLNNANL